MPVKTTLLKTEDGRLSDADLARVAQAAKGCKLIAFPTDTVYGIGSTGIIKAAARRIYQVKQRPNLKPLPVLVHSAEAAKRWVQMTPEASALAARFWPGALTLVLRPTPEGRLLTFPEYQTVALRVPNHKLLLQLIEASGVPWAATSANISGSPSLLDGGAVMRQFDGLVDFVIDGGPSGGVESTIVDASQPPVRVLREGALSSAQILEAVKAAA